jgi:septum formation protein
MRKVILASTSPARKALMATLGIPYSVEAPGVDEDVPPGIGVEVATAMLAERKARAVADRNPGAIVIGSDQLVELEGRAIGKSPDAAAAREQLQRMSGVTHRIITAVCVISDSTRTEIDVASLTMRPLTDEEMDAYIATGEWQGCAGGYRIEGKGRGLFTHIDGDSTSIQGLPLPLLRRMLRGP